MNSNNLVEQENRKIRHLQLMVDLTIQLLYQSDGLTFSEGLLYIENARKFVFNCKKDDTQMVLAQNST